MIIVDESDPIDELAPTFPYRDVTIRHDTSIREAYELLHEIGRGKFGRVYRCKDRGTGLILAAKVVETKRKDERQNVEREIEIMRKLQHPRVIQLFDAIEDIRNWEMCLILEMVEGGELFDRVIQDEFILTERACSVFVRQICEGIDYIHSKNILHLDMKPENVMCVSKTGNRVKIIDFGLARFYDPSKKLQVLFGTPEFVAPEVVNFEEINYSTDMWSIGVITYVLLSGLSPFMGETDIETMGNVTIAKYDFDDECFDDISDEAKDFVEKLLKKDKGSRMTALGCLKHRWLELSSVKKETFPDSDNDIDSELDLGDDAELPDLRKESSNEDSSLSSATPDSLVMSSLELPTLPIYLKNKRPSLDLSKDHLKEFVSRWTDNPYVFDSPRGVITISQVRKEGEQQEIPISCNVPIQNKSHLKVKNASQDKVGECGINIVNQIRRFSQQLHEEMEIMKKQCHQECNTLRKCSWSDVSVNAH